MCTDTHRCNAWISLEDLGVLAQGCLKDSKWISSIKVPTNHSIINPQFYIDLPGELLYCVKNVAHGHFGYIDLAHYNNGTKKLDVFVKRPIIAGKSLLQEACIQKLVGESLARIGFPTGAPPLVSIFSLKDKSVCFAMEQIEGAVTLDKYLDAAPQYQFAEILIDCLLQLSAMIWHLDRVIGINHRDLKPSNFLIVEHDVPIRKILNIDTDIIEIQSKYSLTFIDFGFSCLGSTETNISDISLSNVYPRSDPCPKEGRDMYLFLAFLYINYYRKLPPKLISLLELWLDIPGSNICHFMRKDTENSKTWIYFITGNDKIKRFHSYPSRIFKDLQALI